MRMIGAALRLYAFLFNLATGLAMLLLVMIPHGRGRLHLPIIPLGDAALPTALIGGSIFVFLAVGLASKKSVWARLPMLLWNLALPLVLVFGATRAGFTFDSPDEAKVVGYFLLVSVVALWGSWLHLRHKK